MRIYEISYRPREKNLQFLADMDMAPAARNEIIARLTCEDCFAGPSQDTFMVPPMPDYFEFGKEYKGVTIYIKINLGRERKYVDCMSFHVAEYAITYPLKNN